LPSAIVTDNGANVVTAARRFDNVPSSSSKMEQHTYLMLERLCKLQKAIEWITHSLQKTLRKSPSYMKTIGNKPIDNVSHILSTTNVV
jgi:hypothetical protein